MPDWVERTSDCMYLATTVLGVIANSRSLASDLRRLRAAEREVQRASAGKAGAVDLRELADAVHAAERARRKVVYRWASQAKYACDLVSSSTDALRLPTPKLLVIVAGMLSAYLGTFKIFYK